MSEAIIPRFFLEGVFWSLEDFRACMSWNRMDSDNPLFVDEHAFSLDVYINHIFDLHQVDLVYQLEKRKYLTCW